MRPLDAHDATAIAVSKTTQTANRIGARRPDRAMLLSFDLPSITRKRPT
jgi:hypothetical protein